MSLFGLSLSSAYFGIAAPGGQSWAEYADSVSDSLLALEFRGAASLAAATLYGSAPTVIREPGGGVNIDASGLICADDTELNTGLVANNGGGFYMAVRISGGSLSGSAPIGGLGSYHTYFYSSHPVNKVSAVWLGAADFTATEISDGTLMFINGRYYVDGSFVTTLMAEGSPGTAPIRIGSRGDAVELFDGVIEAAVVGELTPGYDADAVASTLTSKMSTAA